MARLTLFLLPRVLLLSSAFQAHAQEFTRNSFSQSSYAPISYLPDEEKCCQYGRQFCAHGDNLGELAKLDFAVYNLMLQEHIANANFAIADGRGRLVKNVGYTNCQAYPHEATAITSRSDSLYRYASLSKIITGGLLALLEGKGQLDDSHKVGSFLALKNKKRDENLRLFQLHSVYRDWGYDVLAKVIESETKADFYGYLKTELLRPLGMSSIRVATNLVHQRQEQEVEYFSSSRASSECRAPLAWAPLIRARHTPGHPCVSLAYGSRDLEAHPASEGLIGNASDLLLFLRNLQTHNLKNSLFSREIIEKIKKGLEVNRRYRYGHGLKVGEYQDQGLHSDTSFEGTRNFVFFMQPDVEHPLQSEVMVSLLTNRDYNAKIEKAFIQRLMFEIIPSIKDWGDGDQNLFYRAKKGEFPNKPKYDGQIIPVDK